MEEDEIYIVGMSCRAPLSNNIEEYWSNLQEGVDMSSLSESRWPNGIYGLPERLGLINDITKFDAEYFGFNEEQSNNMDPQLRIVQEVVAEAIFDSGIPLTEFNKQPTGIYTTVLKSETESLGHHIEQCSTSMHAAKLARFFNVTGPTLCVDTACSSALVGVHLAAVDLNLKKTKMAIVTGVSLLLSPNQSLQNLKLGMLSAEGQCFTWDERADGYLRSEGVYAIVLVAGQTFPRIYAQVVSSGTNCDGFKSEGVTFPSRETQVQLLRDVYENVEISDVAYLECHATGTQAGDPVETGAICDYMKEKGFGGPILVGSCKSNIGHAEWAAGLASLIKAVLCLYHGKIAPNRNLENINPKIEGFRDCKLIPVTELTSLPDGLVGVSAMGFGGSNCHVILKSFKSSETSTTTIRPRLVVTASRTAEGLEYQEELINFGLIDHRLLPHLTSAFAQSLYTDFFKYRQAWILTDELKSIKPIKKTSLEKEPRLWLNIHDIAMSYENDEPNFDNPITVEWMKWFGLTRYDIAKDFVINPIPMKTICVMTAVQILRNAGVNFEGVVGCGISDLIAGYVDGAVDSTVLLVLTRAIGMYLQKSQPSEERALFEVYSDSNTITANFWNLGIICDYTFDCVCVSVSSAYELKFTSALDVLGIVYRKVKLVHSHLYTRNVAPAVQELREKLQSWTGKKARTSKWLNALSTAPCSPFITPRYLTTCCTSTFSLLVPTAIIPTDATILHIGTTSRPNWVPENDLYIDSREFIHLMEALAMLYVLGFDVNPDYMNVARTSVPSGTRNLADFVRWDHGKCWPVPNWLQFSRVNEVENTFVVEWNGKLSSILYETWRKIDGFCKTDPETVLELSNIKKGVARLLSGKKQFLLHVFPTSKKFVALDGDKTILEGEFKTRHMSHLLTKSIIHANAMQLHPTVTNSFELETDSWSQCLSQLCEYLEEKYLRVFCSNFWVTTLTISSKLAPTADKPVQFNVDFVNNSCTAMGIYLTMAPISYEELIPATTKSIGSELPIIEIEAARLYRMRPENEPSLILVYAGRNKKNERQLGIAAINSEKVTPILSGITIPHEHSFLMSIPFTIPFLLACSVVQSFEKVSSIVNDDVVITADKCDCLLYSFLALFTSFSEVKTIAVTPSLDIPLNSEPALEVTKRLNDGIPDASATVLIEVHSPTLTESLESASPKTSTPNFSTLEVIEGGISEIVSYTEASSLSGCFRWLTPGRSSENVQDLLGGIIPTVNFVPMSSSAELEVRREIPSCNFRKIINFQRDLHHWANILGTEGSLIHLGETNPNSSQRSSICGSVTILDPFYSVIQMAKLFESREYQSQMWSLINRIKPLMPFGSEDNLAYESSPTITLSQSTPLNILQQQLQRILTETSIDNPVLLNDVNWLEKIFTGEPDSTSDVPLFHSSISPINLQRRTPIPKLLPLLPPTIEVHHEDDEEEEKVKVTLPKIEDKENFNPFEKIVNWSAPTTPEPNLSPIVVKMNSVTLGQPVFLIHPITGNLDLLQYFASQFMFPCYGVQQTEECPNDSLINLARFYLKWCIETVYCESLVLIGYSFGAIIAFMMATEAQTIGTNKKIRLILLDGSPHYVKMPLDIIRDSYNLLNLQAAMDMEILVAFLEIYGNVDVDPIVRANLIDATSLDERIKVAVNYLAACDAAKGTGAKKKFIDVERTKMALLFVRNMKMVDDWNYPLVKFNGDVHLFRIVSNPTHCLFIPRDYGLDVLVTGKVSVKLYDTTHEELVGIGNVPQLIGDLLDVLLS